MLPSTVTVIPAAAGFEVVSVEAAGELSRWPVVGWRIIPDYGYGDSGGILPIALGIVFNADVLRSACPTGACSQQQVAHPVGTRTPRRGRAPSTRSLPPAPGTRLVSRRLGR